MLARIEERVESIEASKAIDRELSEFPRWRADHDGNCIEANSAYLSLAGLTLEEMLGSGWQSIIHPDDEDDVLSHWSKAVQSRSRFRASYRIRNVIRSETIYVTARAQPVISTSGGVVFYGATTVIRRKPITSDHGEQ